MTEKKPLAVLDIQRIGFNELKAHARHERREIGDTSHTDSERTKLNRSIGLDKCPETAAKKYLEQTGAKIDKRNEKPFTRLLLSASPEYFRPGRSDQGGEYDPEKMKAWTKASVKWLRDEFGKDTVHIALHLDETTVHLHALVVPTYEKKTKRRTVRQVSHHKHPAFSEQGSYAACHDRYAAMVQRLGIERGERLPEGARGKKHKTKRQWLSERLRGLKTHAQTLAAFATSLTEREKRLVRDAKTIRNERVANGRQPSRELNNIIKRNRDDNIR